MSSIFLRVETRIGHKVITELEEACELSQLTGLDVQLTISSITVTITKFDEPTDVYNSWLERKVAYDMHRRDPC